MRVYLRAVNDEELLKALDERTKGHGNTRAFAEKAGYDPSHISSIKSGCQRVSMKVATALGFELRWVRVNKEKRGASA